jgi:hypothetical protein
VKRVRDKKREGRKKRKKNGDEHLLDSNSVSASESDDV